MNNFTENELENACIELFKDLNYFYAFGPDIAFDGEAPERKDYQSIILEERLKSSLIKINKNIPHASIDEAVRKILIPESPSLIENNHNFQKMITDGINVQYKRADDSIKTDKVWLFDFKNIDNNDWLVINQFTIIENNNNRRPDLIIFINGLPLVILELKNTGNEETTINEAYNQIQTYKKDISSLFIYNSFLVISDGLIAKAGTLTSSFERFSFWRTITGEKLESHAIPQIEVLIKGMFEKKKFLEIIKHFILFQSDENSFVKILAGYHQYYAVNKAINKTIEATKEKGDRRIGVVWHTQGSGKSLTMVFYTAKLVLEMNNPTVIVITDRNDLDDQLFNTFCISKDILRQSPKQADNRRNLRELLSVESGGIIFTTIQKFSPFEDEDKYPVLTDRKNVIVIADEAHRSQYGMKAKITNDEIKYGYAKYMREAVPNASFIGFTGTPVENEDKSTPLVFGDYIDIYDMTRSVNDKSTVKIYYENRIIKLELKDRDKDLIDIEFDDITEFQEDYTKDKLKSKWGRLEAVVGADKRLNELAEDIVKHFEEREKIFFGKSMIVVMSRRIAIELYKKIIKLRPDWYSEYDNDGKIKIVITGSASDTLEWQKFIGNKIRREYFAKRIKDVNDPLKLVIVRDMWLTGFDVPAMHTIYIDKPMKGHNLMQAIARVNRVFKDKEGGLVVDYIGIAGALKNALAQYTDSDKKTTGIDTSEAVAVMIEKYEIIKGMLIGFDYSKFFSKSSKDRMSSIAECMDFVIGKGEKDEKEFINTVIELEKAHTLCVTVKEAQELNLEIAYFKTVKTSIIKLKMADSTKPKLSKEELEARINQLVSDSIISGDAIDVFDMLNIKKPDISIFSEDFMNEIRGLKHKNLAVELLKKILNGKIRSISKKNLIKSKKFSEMLNNALIKYKNQAITNTQVIEELINIAKDFEKAKKEGKHLGLSEEEEAFYDALCVSEAAVKIMGDKILKQIAHDLAEAIRNNLTIDWNLREALKAKMRLIVKKLLKKYNYPPDHQEEAVKTVMEQAELLCREEEN